MKKQYIIPTMEVVKISTVHMLAASLTDSTTGVKFSEDADAVTTSSGMDARRQNSFWDD